MLHLLQRAISFQSCPFPLGKNHRKSTSGLELVFGQLLLKRRKCKFHSLGAVERDSEYEVDPAKAQEALRKLDEELQSIAEKQIDPPKIRGILSFQSLFSSRFCVCFSGYGFCLAVG